MTLQPIFNYKILLKSLINRKSSDNRVLIKSGRLAFNYIISAIKEKTIINNIILPNLICDEVVDVIRSHNIKIKYYNINNCLKYNINEIERLAIDQNNIIMFVNYFGFVQHHFISEKIKNNFIIEDNAHVLKKTKNHMINTDIDYSFTSLRKLLPVLSGAEIYSSKHRLKFKSSVRFPDLGEIKYSLRGLKKSRSGTSKMGHSVSNINYRPSSIDAFSKNIINNYSFDYSDITNKRRKNFMFWEKYLSNHDVTFLKTIENEPEICPYAFPCYVDDKIQQEKWIKWGRMHNITVIEWPKYHKTTLNSVPDNFLRHILLFPVNDQFDLEKIIG